MADRSGAWEVTASSHFAFLESAFGMRIIDRDASTFWETSVTYGRDPVAVIVRSSIEFDRAEVELVRLVAAKVPPVPIFVHLDTRLDRYLLDDLLAVRAPGQLEILQGLNGLGPKEVDDSLSFQATALKEYASDFLEGDMTVLQDLDRFVKAKVAQNPPKMTISFPEGTSREHIDKQVAEASRVDPKVAVEVQFYTRPVQRPTRWTWPWKRG